MLKTETLQQQNNTKIEVQEQTTSLPFTYKSESTLNNQFDTNTRKCLIYHDASIDL